MKKIINSLKNLWNYIKWVESGGLGVLIADKLPFVNGDVVLIGVGVAWYWLLLLAEVQIVFVVALVCVYGAVAYLLRSWARSM